MNPASGERLRMIGERHQMGMFNSIYADLLCPQKEQIAKNAEIQIKWQQPEARNLDVYHRGDTLPQIDPEYDNAWIRTDYICSVCSKQTTGRDGTKYIKTEDQSRHLVFVNIRDATIRDLLTELEFDKTGIRDFVTYL